MKSLISIFSLMGACALVVLSSCGAVAVPDQHYYRLRWPQPSGGALLRAGTLRIAELELATTLAGDRLMVARGPVEMQPYQFHHWAGPLDELVADTLVAGLSRARCFQQVKSAGERGGEEFVLSGRVLDCHQVVDENGWHGLVTLDLRLVDASDGRLYFQSELTSRRPVSRNDPAAAVLSISLALDEIVEKVLVECQQSGIFVREPDANPSR